MKNQKPNLNKKPNYIRAIVLRTDNTLIEYPITPLTPIKLDLNCLFRPFSLIKEFLLNYLLLFALIPIIKAIYTKKKKKANIL